MNIEKELKKNGITVIDKLDTLSINTLAKNIAQKLCRAFPNQRFIAQKLFIAISRIPMYYAEMPEGLSEANYFYKNSSIYFRAGLSLDEIEKFDGVSFITDKGFPVIIVNKNFSNDRKRFNQNRRRFVLCKSRRYSRNG